jgi:hypothetical protein
MHTESHDRSGGFAPPIPIYELERARFAGKRAAEDSTMKRPQWPSKASGEKINLLSSRNNPE